VEEKAAKARVWSILKRSTEMCVAKQETHSMGFLVVVCCPVGDEWMFFGLGDPWFRSLSGLVPFLHYSLRWDA